MPLTKETIADLEREAMEDDAPQTAGHAPAMDPAPAANDAGQLQEQPAPAAAPSAGADDWSMVVNFAVALGVQACPDIEPIWTKEACAEIAAAIPPVAAKYNIEGFDDFLRRYPELILIAAIVPPTLATIRLLKAKQGAIEAPAADVPGADPVKKATAPAPADAGPGDGSFPIA